MDGQLMDGEWIEPAERISLLMKYAGMTYAEVQAETEEWEKLRPRRLGGLQQAG